jgi:hypothetical protein
LTTFKTNKISGSVSCPNCEFHLEITGQVVAKDPLPKFRKTLRKLSETSRKNIATAQRRRWAKYRADKEAEIARRVQQMTPPDRTTSEGKVD